MNEFLYSGFALNVWQYVFFGAVGGLLCAAVFWFLYRHSCDIFLTAAYQCSVAGSIVLGIAYALFLFYGIGDFVWQVLLWLIVVFWNGSVWYASLREGSIETIKGFLRNKGVWLVFFYLSGWLCGICILCHYTAVSLP